MYYWKGSEFLMLFSALDDLLKYPLVNEIYYEQESHPSDNLLLTCVEHMKNFHCAVDS